MVAISCLNDFQLIQCRSRLTCLSQRWLSIRHCPLGNGHQEGIQTCSYTIALVIFVFVSSARICKDSFIMACYFLASKLSMHE